jgi:hypothetical protein
MKNVRKARKAVPAEAIARLADQGKDVSRFFTNTGQMMGPIQRGMLTWPRACWRNWTDLPKS